MPRSAPPSQPVSHTPQGGQEGRADCAESAPGPGARSRNATATDTTAPQERFDLVRGPAATIAAQVRWRGPLVVAVDGTLLPVPDTPANLTVFAKQRCNHGSGGYPQVRLAALVACGTRAVAAVDLPLQPEH
ncbi:hypothetical protein V2J94_40645 [Streptomyces sp. DSM 41524]|uniref:Transposase IS701-like DDE domain-containing protein n=1 Tax=Streptomyces asiaticus subsp. ignotus TaxID=3098222 RepID=A0ABU7Q9N4_9ACTN|nr:hypothetical protein [Streptomyces sp. DSM 41524]